MSTISKWFSYVLVLYAVILTIWGVLGLIEYFVPAAALGLQNATFPPGTQFLHFVAILGTGVVFLVGFFTRWRYTAFATIVMYAVLATLCFVETFDFMVRPDRYVAIAIEYAMYIGFGTYLLRSKEMRRRFGWSAQPSAAR